VIKKNKTEKDKNVHKDAQGLKTISDCYLHTKILMLFMFSILMETCFQLFAKEVRHKDKRKFTAFQPFLLMYLKAAIGSLRVNVVLCDYALLYRELTT